MNSSTATGSAPGNLLRAGGALVLAACLAWQPALAADATKAVAAAQPAKKSASKAIAQASYDTPAGAVEALVGAVRERQAAALLTVLGPGAREALRLTDRVAMRTEWERFASAYDRKHDLRQAAADRAVLSVGDDGWEFPYPLVMKDGRWRFDTDAGNEEVVARRVGANELYTIETVLAIVDAQREYARRDWDGDGLLVYASKFASSPGKKDGLYWGAKAGEPESPLGPLVAQARAEGYGPAAQKGSEKAGGGSAPRPYHGYVYRILTGQGPDAPGGAYDYRVRGKLLGGFALVAFPAQYGVTGVMTFIVNHEGVVYEKDLGPGTPKLAQAMKAFNPDRTWKVSKKG